MVPLETLLKAAEGAEAETEAVRADFEQRGLGGWLRLAIERRLDPALGARVVPRARSAEVLRALEGFYVLWGRWFPAEYRRVRREWVVLQARWRGAGEVDPSSFVGRFFREGLADAGSLLVPAPGGGFEAGLEELNVSGVNPKAGGQRAPGAAGEAVAEASEREREAPPREPAPVVRAGDAVGGRMPDGTEILGDALGSLLPAAACDRLDRAVRGGVEEVEKVRAAWLSGRGFWCTWPEPGRCQERSR